LRFFRGFFIWALLSSLLGVGIILGFDISKHRIKTDTVEVPNSPAGEATINVTQPTILSEQPEPKPPSKVHYKDKVAVITYHNIDETESAYTISPERFHLEMQALKDNGYNVVSVEDFIQFLQNKKPIPQNAVVITFDDGYKSVYTYAFPELKKQGFTATTFLIVHYQQSYNPALLFLSWDQIKEMKNAGFSFYSHTFNLHDPEVGEKGKLVQPLTHRIFIKKRLETEAEYEKKVRDDLSLADNLLKEQLGNQFNLICFPHGEYNQKVLDISQKIGIHYFFTGFEGINMHTSTLIKRINVGSPYISPEQLIKKLNYFENH
jgi:peptidoglycan/xylan/chitin deacetylase (PgdA/CDA1 family)